MLSLQITPQFGPKEGQISVTIKGSNLGIKKEDIKRITVADIPCEHQADRYQVSTRYCITAYMCKYISHMQSVWPISVCVYNFYVCPSVSVLCVRSGHCLTPRAICLIPGVRSDQ